MTAQTIGLAATVQPSGWPMPANTVRLWPSSAIIRQDPVMSQSRLPLEGVNVVEIGQALAGPLSGVILADLGADVIKIEKPDGGDDARLWGAMATEDASLMFNATNRSK